MTDAAAKLVAEGNAILDSLHDGFAFDMRTDSRIAEVWKADERLRAILALLADA